MLLIHPVCPVTFGPSMQLISTSGMMDSHKKEISTSTYAFVPGYPIYHSLLSERLSPIMFGVVFLSPSSSGSPVCP